jgi:hypothetical protein
MTRLSIARVPDRLYAAYLFDLEGGWTDVRAILAVPDRYLQP